MADKPTGRSQMVRTSSLSVLLANSAAVQNETNKETTKSGKSSFLVEIDDDGQKEVREK